MYGINTIRHIFCLTEAIFIAYDSISLVFIGCVIASGRFQVNLKGSTLFNGCGFGPPLPLTAASTWTWIDHPVSGLLLLTLALLRLGFPTAPHLKCLTLPVSVTRRTVLQKVRGRTYKVLPQLVDTGFQVLFHSPPGVLFTFPSQYYALSVTEEYLALEGGPSCFPQGFPCLVVLWILPASHQFRLRDFHPL